jgi:isochorismate synthase
MFEQLKSRYQNQLPFVVFRTPNSKLVKYYLQNNDDLNEISDFNEQGFVFAPFNSFENGKTVLFPISNCKIGHFECQIGKTVGYPKEMEDNLDVATNIYISLIDKALNNISNGNLKKVVLSQPFYFELKEVNPLAIFESMLNAYSSAFVYCWYHPKVGTWLGATPETLLTLKGNQLSTMSLAGTQKFKEKAKVNWQEKELDEQNIVTNFIRNQLEASGIHSNQITSNEVKTIRAGNLWHLQTKIDVRINLSNFSLKNLLCHLHPTPAVCGEPKSEAYQFILKHEGYDRQYYTGFLGEINIFNSEERNKRSSNVENSAYKSVNKTTNLYVNLRCMQIIDKQAVIYVGGGITKDSKPENEWQELLAKLQTVKSVL